MTSSTEARVDPADRLTADEVLELLGPAWSRMSEAEKARYGPTPVQPDRLFSALETLGDLVAQIEPETVPILERIEVRLLHLERRVLKPTDQTRRWWQRAGGRP